MTTTTALAAPARARRTRRHPRGLASAMLILHRSALWFWLALVAVAAVATLWMYGWGADAAFAEFVRKGCADGVGNSGCDFNGPAYARYATANTVSGGLITFGPLLTALWAGTALIARELENGTARLAWTQSVSPARWLAAKLAVPAALLTAGTLLLVLLHRLAWDAHTELFRGRGPRQWQDTTNYVANGTLAPAYALLGLAVGALTGLLVRRSLAASVGTFLAFLALQSAITSLRPYLWPVETPNSENGFPDYLGAIIGAGAEAVTGHDVVGFYRDHHPASHFWPLQLMETGIVLTVAATATATAFWLLRRRTA